MATRTLDELLAAVASLDDLPAHAKKRIQDITGRWDDGIMPSSEELLFIRTAWEKGNAIIVCKHLRNRRCLQKDRQDPVTGAPMCNHIEDQPKCPVYAKGDN